MTAKIIDFQDRLDQAALNRARECLFLWGWLPSDGYALVSIMGLPSGELGEAKALRLREELVGPDIAATAAEIRRDSCEREEGSSGSKVIQFPGLIENVARRILPVVAATSYEESETEYDRMTVDLRIGLEGGLDLNRQEWEEVYRCARAKISSGEYAHGQ